MRKKNFGKKISAETVPKNNQYEGSSSLRRTILATFHNWHVSLPFTAVYSIISCLSTNLICFHFVGRDQKANLFSSLNGVFVIVGRTIVRVIFFFVWMVVVIYHPYFRLALLRWGFLPPMPLAALPPNMDEMGF